MSVQEIKEYILEVHKDWCKSMDMLEEYYYEVFGNSDDWIKTEESSYRHWTNVEVIGKIGDKLFQWDWATSDGDRSVQDLGFEFNWNSLKEVTTKELIKEELTLNQYQKQAMTTCMDSSKNFSYMILNLVGEIGEFASKIAKGIRKEQIEVDHMIHYTDEISNSEIKPFNDELKKEAGDILWQLSGLCEVMGWTLEEVAQMNLDKLQSRQKRNVIEGSGDYR